MVAHLFASLFHKPGAASVAKQLGKQMGAAPSRTGDKHRLAGTWQGIRCKIVLDGASDEMTVAVTASLRVPRWEIRWSNGDDDSLSWVSTQVALTGRDEALLKKLPMKVQLHVIEVVEAGRGSIRLSNGSFVLTATRASLTRGNAAEQAGIRLDVFADLVKAAGAAWKIEG